MKLLNLDNLHVPTMGVTFKGVEYPVKDMDVGLFLEMTKEEQEMSAADGQRHDVEKTLAVLKRVLPSMPDAVMSELTFPQLYAIVSFINGKFGEMGADAAQSTAQAEGAAEGNATAE